ncbi:MAG: hypothetical protein L0191_10375, partial [Acidobacteria bacterium]|nr:hypothetical protein [Acidobacteriota bacterium]
IEELNPEVPAELRRLIRRCLAKNPDQRLDSMRALALELREIVEEYEALSASATSASSGGTGALAAPRTGRTWLMTGVAAVALLGLAGIAFGIYQFVRNRGSGPAGETVSESLEMTSLMSRPLINSIALSRGSRYLAYVTGPAGRWSLWVRQVATGSEVPILTAQKSSPLGLAFSPDENYLYYHMQDPGTPNLTVRLLFEVPALGGSPQKRAVNVASAVSFAPDGKRICFQRRIPQKNESTLVILDLQSGTEMNLATLKAPQSFAGAPSWSPDGKNIASSVSNPAEGGQGGHVIALEVEGGGQTEIGSAPWLFVNSIAWLPDGSGLVIAASHQSTLGQSALWMLTYPEGRAHKITNDLNTYSGVNVSGDGASIASIRSARFSNLWAVPSDGSGRPRQLTNTSGSQDSVFTIAATGNSGVVFQARDGRYNRLWRIGLDGSGRRPLTSGPTHSILPEGIPGGGMAFMQAGEDLVWHLWAMGADGSDPRRLTHGAGEVIPVVSPDGKTLLYRRADLARELWAIPLAGGEPRRIVTQSDAYGRFSRDGKWIAYGSWVEVDGQVTGRWRIVPASGGEPIASFSMRPGSSSVDWAPDGSAITFPAEEEGVFQIFRQPIGGGDPKPITRFTEGLIKSHAWSPDGRRIGLTRTIADVDNLWSVAADGSNPVRLTDFEEGNVFVANATEDGKQILFVFGRESKDVVLIRNFR